MTVDTYVSNSRPVIVGGAARSGTTLVSVILNSHPDLVCGPESDLFRLRQHLHRLSVGPARWLWHVLRGWTELFASIARDFDISIWRIRRMWRASRTPSAFIDRFFSDYARRHGVSRWADKTPANVKGIEYLFRHFPGAKFVHVIRDGRDVCCSVQDWYRRYHQGRTLEIESAAETWARRVGLGRAWRQHPGYTEVYYEDMIFRPEETLRRLLAFLEMAWAPVVLNFHQDAQRNRPRPAFGAPPRCQSADLRIVGRTLAPGTQTAGPRCRRGSRRCHTSRARIHNLSRLGPRIDVGSRCANAGATAFGGITTLHPGPRDSSRATGNLSRTGRRSPRAPTKRPHHA